MNQISLYCKWRQKSQKDCEVLRPKDLSSKQPHMHRDQEHCRKGDGKTIKQHSTKLGFCKYIF